MTKSTRKKAKETITSMKKALKNLEGIFKNDLIDYSNVEVSSSSFLTRSRN
jgi:hypothetical protein